MARDVRATFIDPRAGVEHTVGGCVVRQYRFSDPFVSAPATDVPNWVAAGCEVVAATDDGDVLAAYTIRDVSEIDLTAQRVTELPNAWHGNVVQSFHRF